MARKRHAGWLLVGLGLLGAIAIVAMMARGEAKDRHDRRSSRAGAESPAETRHPRVHGSARPSPPSALAGESPPLTPSQADTEAASDPIGGAMGAAPTSTGISVPGAGWMLDLDHPETVCDDGDPCTFHDRLQDGKCVGIAVDCDDDNPLTDDSCNGDGCTHEFVEGAFDSGS
jgi:hypothetical protein